VKLVDQPALLGNFLQLVHRCTCVVACRVTPYQKQQIVRFMRDSNPDLRTLAIGDGANDVPMIQAAHVGVGISGEEGLQAANSADFSFGQFRFLRHLMHRHGRFNYRRLSSLVCFMFHKNILLTTAQYWFSVHTKFSGSYFSCTCYFGALSRYHNRRSTRALFGV
jgi:phospholipid-transporting ATPase